MALGSGEPVKLQSIQTLRAVAVLGVVLCHARFTNYGSAGVDLFFVISGFIIATVAPGKRPLQFAFDRCWRVFPLYWLASIPWLALAFAYGMGTPLRTLTSLTLIPFEGIPYLTPGWSLMFEMLFYAAACVILATGRWVPFALAWAGCAAWGYFVRTPLTDFLGFPLILNFLMGAAIAKVGPTTARNGMALIALGAIAFVLSPDMTGPGLAVPDHWTYLRAVTWGVPSALVLWGAVSLESPRWPLQLIGNASYSIYLTHQMIVVALPWWAGIPLALAVGIAAHLWVELPLLRAKPAIKFSFRPLFGNRWREAP